MFFRCARGNRQGLFARSEVLLRCSEAVGSEARLARMSVRSFSESISEAALRTGKARLVAHRDNAS